MKGHNIALAVRQYSDGRIMGRVMLDNFAKLGLQLNFARWRQRMPELLGVVMPWCVREMHVRYPDRHIFRISQGAKEEE
jgi:hypothetical protein